MAPLFYRDVIVIGSFLCFMLLSVTEAGSLGHRSHHHRSYSDELLAAAAAESNADRPADRMTLKFSTPEMGTVRLTLKKVDVSYDKVPTYVGSGGSHRTKAVQRLNEDGYSLTSYADFDSHASVIVERRKDADGHTVKTYRGSFSAGDKYYWLAPVLASKTEGRGRFQPGYDAVEVDIDGVEHFVAPAEFDSFRAYDSVVQSKLDGVSSHRSHGTQRNKANYIVELLIVLDYSIYKYWYDTYARGISSVEKDRETILLLRHYFAGVSDGVHYRYASIQEADYSIAIKLVGFYIATTAEDSQFTEGSDVKIMYEGWGYIHMNTCLKKFGKWVSDNAPTYGPFDHAVLFVANYLYDKLENGVPQTKSGLANLAGVCKRAEGLCTSINYERGVYSSIQTGAHELAHNLGSKHDGEGNECESKDQFIMATAPGELNDQNKNNPFKFSPCSLRYLRDELAKLTSQNTNCLLTIDSTFTLQIEDLQLPGVIQSVDAQCANYQGTESFYCAGMQHDAELCTKIVCWDPEESKCQWESAEHRAYAGTTCGNKKWCLGGQCIYDAKAIEANETCLYGDYRGDIFVNEQNPKIKCPDLVKQFPDRCYDGHHFNQCCNACPSVRRLNKPDCIYGDRSPARCLLTTSKPVHCYDEAYQRDCCDWCDKLQGTNPSCLYGDKVDFCKTLPIAEVNCYVNHDKCCETCPKHHTDIVGCEYGDKVTWCGKQELDAESCQKTADVGKQCCGSCAAKFPGGIVPNADLPPGGSKPPVTGATAKCPLGDTVQYCHQMKDNPALCKDAAKDKCCASCEKLETGIPGCSWGDEITDCKSPSMGLDHQWCLEDPNGVGKQCCKTCHEMAQRASAVRLIEELLDELKE